MNSNFYVGINGTNVICNQEYFDGYITAYPLGEKNNISFFDNNNKNTSLDLNAFKIWVQQKVNEILKQNPNAKFTFFNKKMENICDFITSKNICAHNDWSLLDFVNNKFLIRKHFSNKVPMLDYKYKQKSELSYNNLIKEFNSNIFVLQSYTGSGGLTTHFVKSENDIESLNLNNNETYIVSAYQQNLPINSTVMIAGKGIYFLPCSVQLIKNNGNFIYEGGDFAFANKFNNNIKNQINSYNTIIAKELQNLGYRGICGIDYILCPDGKIKFMEINPRYQGSSFLISIHLEKFNTSIARLNAECFVNDYIKVPDITINQSFVNCLNDEDYNHLGDCQILKKVAGATFRKIYNKPIIYDKKFEKTNNLNDFIN